MIILVTEPHLGQTKQPSVNGTSGKGADMQLFLSVWQLRWEDIGSIAIVSAQLRRVLSPNRAIGALDCNSLRNREAKIVPLFCNVERP
jgi:hypothetical protein